LGGEGVYSSFDGASLDNFGAVYSDIFAGVAFNGNSSVIVNEAGAIISGGPLGIGISGDGETIKNLGSVFGLNNLGDGVRFDFNANHFQLTNYGSVAGHGLGVGVFSHFSGGVIDNYGSISSDKHEGIGVETLTPLTTEIFNAKGGTITGGTLGAVVSGKGGIDLHNAGTINGTIYFSDTGAINTIVNRGSINGVVELDGASDFFNGKAGTSGAIYAGAGNDVIIAGGGTLSLYAGGGNATMTAGSGHDQFVFRGSLGSHPDLIKHFNPHRDTIALSTYDFPGLGPLGPLHAPHFHINGNAHNASPQVVYMQSDGFLFYDSNGDLPGGQTHFATLAGHPHVGVGEFMIGL
jgi:Ca2+-binding RTX toxin-like protein